MSTKPPPAALTGFEYTVGADASDGSMPVSVTLRFIDPGSAHDVDDRKRAAFTMARLDEASKAFLRVLYGKQADTLAGTAERTAKLPPPRKAAPTAVGQLASAVNRAIGGKPSSTASVPSVPTPSSKPADAPPAAKLEECNTTAHFEAALASGPVVAQFSAPWCGPCKQQRPIVEQVAADFPQVRTLYVDVDTLTALASRYEVRGVPALIAFHDGKPADNCTGLKAETRVRQLFEAAEGK